MNNESLKGEIMTFERIVFTLVISILIFIIIIIIYMAVRKIKWQDKRINHLERLLELQGKVEDGTQDVG